MGNKYTIGGSEVAAVMGYSPWTSPAQLYDRIMGTTPRTPPSLAQLFGTCCEAGVVQMWCHITGTDPALVVQPQQMAKDGWMRGTADRMICRGGMAVEGLEIKITDNNDGGFGRTGTRAWPLYYKTQCAWYRNIYNVPTWRLVALIYGTANKTVGLRLAEYIYEKDTAFEDKLIASAREFYDKHLMAGVRPPEREKIALPTPKGSAPDWMTEDATRTGDQ